MKTKVKWLIVVLFLVFAGLQFTSPARTNPPFDEKQNLAVITDLPPDVAEIFKRSCNDCHSNQTNWRFYTHIAPISWFTVKHVNEGRAELNFSEWGTYDLRKQETRLSAICGVIEYGSMPLESYLWAHSEAKLSPEEIGKICAWSRAESQKSPR